MTKRQKIGPWSSVSEGQAKQVQEAVDGIMGAATHYKGATDADEEVDVDELIGVFTDMAGYAYTSLLILNPTRSKQNCEPGPLEDINSKQAKYIRQLFKEVLELAVDGLQRAKANKRISSTDFCGHFSMIKKYAMELEGYFDPGDEDEAA